MLGRRDRDRRPHGAGAYCVEIAIPTARTSTFRDVSKFWIGVIVVAVFGLVLFVSSIVENDGCMPWQTAVTTGGRFSEGGRMTHCR
jgi:hypothetical protein